MIITSTPGLNFIEFFFCTLLWKVSWNILKVESFLASQTTATNIFLSFAFDFELKVPLSEEVALKTLQK
jgi:hypothetical protein